VDSVQTTPPPGDLPDRDGARPLLVHLVANGVRGDSRVLKCAQVSQAAGIPTLILGVGRDADGELFDLQGVRVVLVGIEAPRPKKAGRGAAGPASLGAWAKDGARLAARRRPRVRKALGRTAQQARALRARVRVTPSAAGKPKADVLATLGPMGQPSATWAKGAPGVYRIVQALAGALTELNPTAIHCHDTVPLVAATSYRRTAAAATGLQCPVIYDAHEWVEALARKPKAPPSITAMSEIEEAFIGQADAVLTVSPEIARRLRTRFDLTELPTVVLNAPSASLDPDAPALRDSIGLPADVPLMVYSGWIDLDRGLDVVVSSLTLLPDVHLALVVGTRSRGLALALELAISLGVVDRVHLAGYVPPTAVTAYLSSADIGLIPHASGEHLDVSLPTKFREYLHANLPMVVSDNKRLAEEVERTRVGEVFRSGDVEGFASAARAVLADPDRYRAAITPELRAEHSWEAQEGALLGVYTRLGILPVDRPADVRVEGRSGQPVALAELPESLATTLGGPGQDAEPTVPSRSYLALAVGPVNSAGQAHAWAAAVRDNLGVRATSFGAASTFGFPVDRVHPRSPQTMTSDAEWLLIAHTHVLVDAFHSVLSAVRGVDIGDELDVLRRRAVRLALAVHGSEIRDPDLHMARLPESYFHVAPVGWMSAIRQVVSRNRQVLSMYDGPVFVSTPDLLLDIPTATWLPLALDLEPWRCDRPALTDAGPPVVLHAPSRTTPPIKGSDIVVPVLTELHDAGRIRFVSAEKVPHEQMPDLVRSADIVVDQIRTGSYGVAAVEAMAAGRLVVGGVAPDVRALLQGTLPVVDGPGHAFADTMERILAEPATYAELAATGPAVAARWHDGRASAEALASFLLE